MLEDQMQPAQPAPLARSLGVVGVLFLTLSVTTPASSVFIIMPGMLQVAGTGAVWAMIGAAIVCVATAYIYAELSSAWPVAGGEYVMVARTLGPLAGFVMLGINVFNNLIFLPVAGLGVSDVLASVVPGLPQVPTAIAVVIVCAAIGVLNIRVNAVITGAFLLLEVATLAVVAVCGFASAANNPLDFLTAPGVASGSALTPVTFTGIGLAASIAIFAFNGYGAAVYFGEEMREAPRRIARTVMQSLVWILVLEGVPLLAALIGAADIPALLTSPSPFTDIVEQAAGPRAGGLVSIGVAIAIVNAIIAWALACARFFYGTARDGSWGRPLDRWLVAIHPRFGSPWLGTLLVGAVGAALCLIDLRWLEILSGTGLIAIYAGITAAVMVARRRLGQGYAPYRMPFYPLAPIVSIVGLALILVTSAFDSDGGWAIVATIAQMAISAVYYLLVLRRRGWTAIVPGDQAGANSPSSPITCSTPSAIAK